MPTLRQSILGAAAILAMVGITARYGDGWIEEPGGGGTGTGQPEPPKVQPERTDSQSERSSVQTTCYRQALLGGERDGTSVVGDPLGAVLLDRSIYVVSCQPEAAP